MLNFKLDTSKVDARLDAMTASIETLAKTELQQELMTWETEDMKRHYPESKLESLGGPDEISATTMIYPRSRTYERMHPHRVRSEAFKSRAAKRPLSAMPVLRQSVMRHPILRPLLFDMLFTRMVSLLRQRIVW